MSILARRLLRLLPLFFLFAVAGCNARKTVSMDLPSFFSAGIDEVWLWRRNEETGNYVRDAHMRLLGLQGPAGSQTLRYTMHSPQEQDEEVLTIEVPAQVSDDSVRADFWLVRWDAPGIFKVTARNAAGESQLSSREVVL